MRELKELPTSQVCPRKSLTLFGHQRLDQLYDPLAQQRKSLPSHRCLLTQTQSTPGPSPIGLLGLLLTMRLLRAVRASSYSRVARHRLASVVVRTPQPLNESMSLTPRPCTT